jgi:hypothetical protein
VGWKHVDGGLGMGKDLEPRQAPKRSVDMFLDLAATEEDHDEVNNVVSALIPSWPQVDKPLFRLEISMIIQCKRVNSGTPYL